MLRKSLLGLAAVAALGTAGLFTSTTTAAPVAQAFQAGQGIDSSDVITVRQGRRAFNRPVVRRHFVNRPVVRRHFVNRPVARRHFVNRHFVRRHFVHRRTVFSLGFFPAIVFPGFFHPAFVVQVGAPFHCHRWWHRGPHRVCHRHW
jgi:hypothetical protein